MYRSSDLESAILSNEAEQTCESDGFWFLTKDPVDAESGNQDIDHWLYSDEHLPPIERQARGDSTTFMDEFLYSEPMHPLERQAATEQMLDQQSFVDDTMTTDDEEEIDLYSEPEIDQSPSQEYDNVLGFDECSRTTPSSDSVLQRVTASMDDDMLEFSDYSEVIPSSDMVITELDMSASDDVLEFSGYSGGMPSSDLATAEEVAMSAGDDMLEFSDCSEAIPSSDSAMTEEAMVFEEEMASTGDGEATESSPLYRPFMKTIRQPREWVLKALESFVSRVLYDLSLGRAPTIYLSSRSKAGAIIYDESTGVIRRKSDLIPFQACNPEDTLDGDPTCGPFTRVTHHNSKSVSRFHAVLRIIELIHENVYNGTISSKRDLFYRDVALFGSQGTVDKLVEDIACTLQVPRSCLNVIAGTRSVVFGSMRMTIRVRGKSSTETIVSEAPDSGQDDGSKENKDGDDPLNKTFTQSDYYTLMTIPTNMNDILRIELHPRTKFVLVLEKEAIMDHLISLGFCESHGPCVLLTSKGYPDSVARQLLKHLSNMIQTGVYAVNLPTVDDLDDPLPMTHCQTQVPLDIPLVALVDCDPHGVEIFLTYRCGSIQSAYDNANLAVPTLRCLGHISDDWNALLQEKDCSFPSQDLGYFQQHPFERSLLPLTVRDRSKLVKLLKQHPFIQRHEGWKRQLSRMLMMNRKSELQGLCASNPTIGSGCDPQDGVGRQGDIPRKQDHALDPWAKHHAWRNSELFTRSARIRTMFPGLGIATVAFAAYLGYEYITAPKADTHHHDHGKDHH
ncbi:MAG: Spo11/DNA topoisomerase VI subunit A [Benniella sp.]|nr:MAG: Spo11/DNA topoisomerase VI subunit A [Benniella sp.]